MPAASTSERRHVPVRCGLALVAAVALTLSLLTPTQPAHAATAPKGRVVLDPDDDYSHAVWNGTTYTELPITYAIAQAAKAKLESLCDTSVVISRNASTPFVDRAQRAAQTTNADVSLTISFNNLTGAPWGTASDGGAQAYATANANSAAFGQKTLDEWSRFTGRPNAGGVNQGGTNGTQYPYPEFAGLPGTYAQTFFGFLGHNFDAAAIGVTTGDYHFVTDAIVTAVGRQLQAQGIREWEHTIRTLTTLDRDVNIDEYTWPPFIVSLNGLSRSAAEELVAYAVAKGLAIGGEVLDPKEWLTGHWDRGSVDGACKAIDAGIQSGLLDEATLAVASGVLEIMNEWLSERE
jgi:N-acetylmuramoyl-L-alanine amidase